MKEPAEVTPPAGEDGRAALTPELVTSVETALRRRDAASLEKFRARLAGLSLAGAEEAWLARLEFALGDVSAALTRYERIAGRGPLEPSDALQALWAVRMLRRPAPLGTLLAGFSSGKLAPHDMAQVARAGDDALTMGDAAGALAAYALVQGHSEGAGLIAPERLGAALLAADRAEEAFARLGEADRHTPLAADALRTLAEAARRFGDHAAADAALARTAGMGAGNNRFSPERHDTAPPGPVLSPDETADQARTALEAAVALRDTAAIASTLKSLDAAAADALGPALGKLGFRLLALPESMVLDALGAVVERIVLNHSSLHFLAIEVALLRQDYAGAAAAITRADRALRGKPAPMFALKRAELAAYAGDLPEALEHLAALEPLEQTDARYLLPAVAILTEARAWPRLLDLARTRLADWFVFSQYAAALAQAAAAEGAWADLLDAVDRALAAAPDNGDLRRLRLLCRERMAAPADLAQLLDDADLTVLPDHRARIATKVAALARIGGQPAEERPAAERETVIFYCADTAYLAAAFTSLNSLMLANAPLLPEVALQLYVEADDLELSETIAGALCRRHGCALEIIPAADALGGYAGDLRTRYGVFTGGRELAAAAYYRIFVLEKLRREDARARALYLDSDTIVAGELSRAFAVLDGSAPIAARPEADRIAVRRVEALHGLARGRYFNSGVLAADLRHPDLARALAGTLAAIGEGERLVYHDQCALNLGFRDAFRVLPDAYNSFCLSGDGLDAPGAGGAVLHFLDRPKPWQSGYEGPFGAFWYRYWAALAEVVDAGAMRALMARSPV